MQLYTFTFWQLSSSSGLKHFLISSFCFHSIHKESICKNIHTMTDECKYSVFTKPSYISFKKSCMDKILNLSHFSIDMEIHEGNMAKDQDGTQQDKNESQKCGLCSYSSKWPSTLKCHMMVHICKQCDYSCAHADKLKQHMLTHSGEKLFQC